MNLEISEGDFDGSGISSHLLRTCVFPAFEALEISTIEDVKRFADDKELQQIAEHVHQVPVVLVEAIANKFRRSRLDKIIDRISEILVACYPRDYVLIKNAEAKLGVDSDPDVETTILKRISITLYVIALSLLLFSIFGVALSYRETWKETLDEDKLAADFAKEAAPYVHAFAKCDENNIHHQKYSRLPDSKEGYLCMRDRYGRLNNKLQEMVNALWFAHELDRTLILDWEIARVYDYIMWQNIFPHVKYRVAIAPTEHNKNLCRRGAKIDSKSEFYPLMFTARGRMTLKGRLSQNNTKYLGVDAYHLFRMEADYSTVRAFHANLWPAKLITEKAEKFIANNFGGAPYVAVHLRDLEGSCVARMKKNHLKGITCSPEKNTTLEIMKQVGLFKDKMVPIFVASDFQKQHARHSYMDKNGYFYRGNCSVHLHECAMIDFEIVSQANFFVGVFASSASRTMARTREFRRTRNGIFYPAILYWDKSKKATLQDYDPTWLEFDRSFLKSG